MSPPNTSETFLQRLRRFSPHRLLLAAAGVVCVGLAGLGVFVPGLPTTIFLIMATYLFARSCPWLEERLIHNRLFSPFLGYLDGSTPMPMKAKLITMCVMWAFVSVSVFLLGRGLEAQNWVIFMPPVAAVVGTWFIVRMGGAPTTPSSP
ncbi:MAG: YbaN family protein [Acidobacteria bacterium]|nr:YbaN family protein [Acidobacteriota bacterium]